jgi:hypothetical protein
MNYRIIPNWGAAVITAALLSSATSAHADNSELMDKIRKLEQRVAELESPAQNGDVAAERRWLDDLEFSGFASASYFYNVHRPASRVNVGRGFDDRHNEFNANKLKLALERPVEISGDKWDAGFRADLIFGEDAALTQAAGLSLGDHGDLQQLYVTVNVPIGTGLQVSAGKFVTLMGVELIEEVDNPNWSVANQFMFVENFTGTGISVGYNWTDWFHTELCVINGWDVVRDNNRGKSLMACVTLTPDARTGISLLGYGGPEQDDDNSAWRKGVQLVVSRELAGRLTGWIQLDYGHEDANPALPKAGDARWHAAGLWLSYALTEWAGLAFRTDYLRDRDGARTSEAAGFPAHTGQDLYSLTVTLNLRPHRSLQVRPELRWDHSNLAGAFNGRRDQVTAGIGVAYVF